MKIDNPLLRLSLLLIVGSLSACATTEPRTVATVNTSLDQTDVIERNNVVMDDSEVEEYRLDHQTTKPARTTSSSARTTAPIEQSSEEETITTSTMTERVVEVVPVAAPNADVILQ